MAKVFRLQVQWRGAGETENSRRRLRCFFFFFSDISLSVCSFIVCSLHCPPSPSERLCLAALRGGRGRCWGRASPGDWLRALGAVFVVRLQLHLQKVPVLLADQLADEARQRLQVAQQCLQLGLQQGDALLHVLAALVQVRDQLVHDVLGLNAPGPHTRRVQVGGVEEEIGRKGERRELGSEEEGENGHIGPCQFGLTGRHILGRVFTYVSGVCLFQSHISNWFANVSKKGRAWL